MAVVLHQNPDGNPINTLGSLAAEDQSAPGSGFFAPKTFGQLGSANGSGTIGAPHAFTPTSAGSSTGFGYADPSQQDRGTSGRSAMSGGGKSVAAPFQGTPDQEIGIPAAKAPDVPPKPKKPSTPSITPSTTTPDDNGGGNEEGDGTDQGSDSGPDDNGGPTGGNGGGSAPGRGMSFLKGMGHLAGKLAPIAADAAL